MPTITKKLSIELPDSILEALGSAKRASKKIKESTVLRLWEEGEISTRVAAKGLGLNYTAFLDLLAKKKIPVSRGSLNLKAIREISKSTKVRA